LNAVLTDDDTFSQKSETSNTNKQKKDHSQQFLSGILLLKTGVIMPDLIPYAFMENLSEQILRKLRTISDQPLFYLTAKSVNELYASMTYNYLKINNSLVISGRIPLSSYPDKLVPSKEVLANLSGST